MMTGHVSGGGWSRVDYLPVSQPGSGKQSDPVLIPALPIMVRNPVPSASATVRVTADGMLDTGAAVPAIPLWAILHMGIAVDDKATKPAFGVSEKFIAYRTKVGVEVMYDGNWVDIGVIDVLAPDTPSSRDPTANTPFLLGRNGFFDKFNMCIDEPNKAVWIRRAAGGGGEPPRNG